ncbi:hypothetical protein, partial [Streptomyces phaeochromogenes]
VPRADGPLAGVVLPAPPALAHALKAFTSLLDGNGFDVAVEQDALLAGTEIYEVFAVRKAG